MKLGKTLKSITDSTGASIQIPRDEDAVEEEAEEVDPEHGPLVSITLSGSSSGVESAKSQILSIVRERTSKTSLELPEVPQELWIFLRAKSDELVKRAQEEGEGEVSVFVPRRVPAGGKRGVDVEEGADNGETSEVKEKSIRITGDKELVKKVEGFIQDEINELVRLSPSLPFSPLRRLMKRALMSQRSTIRPVIFSLPKRQHRFLVGGAISDQILKETGCAVEVPGVESDSEDVVVRGPGRDTIRAMQLVSQNLCSDSTFYR